MTHYVTIVVADNEAEVDRILAPYSEYLEVPEYKEYIDEKLILNLSEKYNIELENKVEITSLLSDYLEMKVEVDENGIYCLTTYNPKSKWDWYMLGGRWENIIPNNRCKCKEIKDYFEEYDYLPSVLVDDDGWHATKNWGWFGSYDEIANTDNLIENLLDKHADDNCFIVDIHI